MSRKKRYNVFVSYSRHDEGIVKPMAGLIGVAAKKAVFLDVESLKPGDLWRSDIENAIRSSSVFVLCWCCEASRSEFVSSEIQIALEDLSKQIVPVLFCATPLPEELKERQWLDFRGKIAHPCRHQENIAERRHQENVAEPTIDFKKKPGTGWLMRSRLPTSTMGKVVFVILGLVVITTAVLMTTRPFSPSLMSDILLSSTVLVAALILMVFEVLYDEPRNIADRVEAYFRHLAEKGER